MFPLKPAKFSTWKFLKISGSNGKAFLTRKKKIGFYFRNQRSLTVDMHLLPYRLTDTEGTSFVLENLSLFHASKWQETKEEEKKNMKNCMVFNSTVSSCVDTVN